MVLGIQQSHYFKQFTNNKRIISTSVNDLCRLGGQASGGKYFWQCTIRTGIISDSAWRHEASGSTFTRGKYSQQCSTNTEQFLQCVTSRGLGFEPPHSRWRGKYLLKWMTRLFSLSHPYKKHLFSHPPFRLGMSEYIISGHFYETKEGFIIIYRTILGCCNT